MLKRKRKNALGITEMGLGPPVISDIGPTRRLAVLPSSPFPSATVEV